MTVSHHVPSTALTLALALAVFALVGCHDPSNPLAHGPVGAVVPITSIPLGQGAHHDARAGDLTLQGSGPTALIFAAAPDLPGRPPLRGSILDIDVGAPVGSVDPVSWWRFGWIDAGGVTHVAPARTVEPTRCENHSAGVTVTADIDGATLVTTTCAAPEGAFVVTTRSRRPLPHGAALADELSVNATPVAIDRVGVHWSPPVRTGFMALSGYGTALAIEAPGTTLVQGTSVANDQSRTVIVARWNRTVATRTVHLAAGDTLDVLGRIAAATHTVTLVGPVGTFALRDASGTTLVTGQLPTGRRVVRLPPGFGTSIVFRDARGVPAREVALTGSRAVSPPVVGGTLHLGFRTESSVGLPVHVVLRGLNGTPDPTPDVLGRAFSGGRSVYLLDGTGDVGLALGTYRVTASHGPRYALSVHDVTVSPNEQVTVTDTLREIVHAPGTLAADFHLHASPSPDSRVPLDERVGSLLCEGVDFAVATDHNHVTDYGPIITALGADSTLESVPGNEVTTYTPFWGHFIAWPLEPGNPREPGVIPYFDTSPARIFADARARGARVVQVNHPRLQPSMGYFDHVNLDPATGHTTESFASGFDAVEVFNGWSIEHPADIRRGIVDLVGLARRGMHPAATGNSDSHELLYEEAGWPRTYVTVSDGPRETLADRVAEGILHARTTISAGPYVTLSIGSAVPGDTVRPEANGHLRAHVHVEAPAWVPVDAVEVWVDDRVVSRQPCGPATDGVRFDGDVDLTVNADAVVLAFAEGLTPLPDVLPYVHAMPLGFTGTIRVDADGDGRVVVPSRAVVSTPTVR